MGISIRDLTFILGVMVTVSLGCGGSDNCPQCNPKCAVTSWPRLVVGLTGTNTTGLDVFLKSMTGEPFPTGSRTAEQSCQCLDHLSGMRCTHAFLLGPSQRDLLVTVRDSQQELGVCPLRLPSHNYCGFNATYIAIQVENGQPVVCGSSGRFDVCKR